MKDIDQLISGLEQSPVVLEELIRQIPLEMLKEKRIKNKWSIHENACHIAEVQPMILERLKSFRDEEKPDLKSYLPGKTVPDDNLMDMDLDTKIHEFMSVRKEQLDIFKTMDEVALQKDALHEEYVKYTPYIMMRHILIHDYFHMYRIEELWLTKDDHLVQRP